MNTMKATKDQLEAIRAFVAKRLEIAVDECAELIGVPMEDADAILAAMPEYAHTAKAYRGRTDFPNVYHAPLGPDPRERADGTRDNGVVLAANVGALGTVADETGQHAGTEPRQAFAGVRAMGE